MLKQGHSGRLQTQLFLALTTLLHGLPTAELQWKSELSVQESANTPRPSAGAWLQPPKSSKGSADLSDFPLISTAPQTFVQSPELQVCLAKGFFTLQVCCNCSPWA